MSPPASAAIRKVKCLIGLQLKRLMSSDKGGCVSSESCLTIIPSGSMSSWTSSLELKENAETSTPDTVAEEATDTCLSFPFNAYINSLSTMNTYVYQSGSQHATVPPAESEHGTILISHNAVGDEDSGERIDSLQQTTRSRVCYSSARKGRSHNAAAVTHGKVCPDRQAFQQPPRPVMSHPAKFKWRTNLTFQSVLRISICSVRRACSKMSASSSMHLRGYSQKWRIREEQRSVVPDWSIFGMLHFRTT